MDRLFFRTGAAMAIGLLVWILLEPSAPRDFSSGGWERWSMNFILALGAASGMVISGINGWLQGSRVHLLRGLGLGLILGAVGATLGASIGNILIQFIGGNRAVLGGFGIVLTIIARVLSLTPVGLFIGVGIGASSLSLERTKHGGLGGLLGGMLAGALFDIIGGIFGFAILAAKGVGPNQVGEVGGFSRMVTAILIPGLIALFINLIERSSRSAWLRQEVGRNEGREWLVAYNPTVIGRSETAHIPVFGDSSVGQRHALIQKENGIYYLIDAGGGQTFLQGQPVSRAALDNGALIQLGGQSFRFFLRSGPTPVPVADAPRGTYSYPNAAQPIANQAHQNYGAPAGFPNVPVAQAVPTATPSLTTSVVALDGPLAGRRFPIGGPTEFGRESQQVPLSFDSMVSRRHALLGPAPGGIAVQDLGSTNGTFINGSRVQNGVAAIGSVIKIGGTSFRVE